MKVTVGRFRQLIREVLIQERSLEPVGADQARELIKKFPKGMKAIGGVDPNNASSLPVLGTGTHGTAFDLGDKVLKITNDAKEAEAAAALAGKDVKGIVRFYDVWAFGDTGVFGITQEKLQPISKEDGDAFNRALVATGLPIWIKRAGGSWDKAKELTKQHVMQQARKNFKDLKSPEVAAYVKDVNEKWDLLTRKYGLREMFETLTSHGIDFHDYHAGNMMQRDDGTLVLIDLGMSKVKGGGKVRPMTEDGETSLQLGV